jgi:flagellar hook-length control protein FliK
MQVTFSTILPNSTAEPAANSHDSTEDSSGVSFFAQMGQIWNLEGEKDVPGEENKTEPQSPADPSGNPMATIINACMLPVPEQLPIHPVLDAASFDRKPTEMPSDSKLAATLFEFDSTPVPAWGRTPANSNLANGPQNRLQFMDPGLNAIFAGPAEGGNIAQDASGVTAADTPVGTTILAEALLQKMPASASPLEGGGRQTARELSETAVKAAVQMPDPADVVSIAKDVTVDSEPQPAVDSMTQSGNSRVADNTGNNVLKESFASSRQSDPSGSSKKAEPISAALREVLQSAADQGRTESAPAISPQPVDIRSESIAASEKAGSGFDLRVNNEAGLRTDADRAPIAAKPAIAAPAAAEHAGTADAQTGQQNSRNDCAASTILQNKTDSVRADQSKPKAPERLQEAASPLASGPARLNDTTATVNASRPQTTGLQSREFIEQLAERIQVQVRDGKGEIRIQLKPDSLGHLEIRAESTVNGVVARIMAESGTVKNYLESNMHQLQQSLQDQGLRIDRIQVSVQDNSGSQSFSGYAAESGHSGSGNQGRSGNRSGSGEIAADLQEELPVDPGTWAALNPNGRFYTIA